MSSSCSHEKNWREPEERWSTCSWTLSSCHSCWFHHPAMFVVTLNLCQLLYLVWYLYGDVLFGFKYFALNPARRNRTWWKWQKGLTLEALTILSSPRTRRWLSSSSWRSQRGCGGGAREHRWPKPGPGNKDADDQYLHFFHWASPKSMKNLQACRFVGLVILC